MQSANPRLRKAHSSLLECERSRDGADVRGGGFCIAKTSPRTERSPQSFPVHNAEKPVSRRSEAVSSFFPRRSPVPSPYPNGSLLPLEEETRRSGCERRRLLHSKNVAANSAQSFPRSCPVAQWKPASIGGGAATDWVRGFLGQQKAANLCSPQILVSVKHIQACLNVGGAATER